MQDLSSLRLARLKAGKCQHEVSLETGIPQSLISLFERNLKAPKKEQLEALSKCLRKIEMTSLSLLVIFFI